MLREVAAAPPLSGSLRRRPTLDPSVIAIHTESRYITWVLQRIRQPGRVWMSRLSLLSRHVGAPVPGSDNPWRIEFDPMAARRRPLSEDTRCQAV